MRSVHLFGGVAAAAAGGLLFAAALGVGDPPAPAPARPRAGAVPAPRPPELVRPSDLVTAQRGTLPIILSAPHGGQVRVHGSRDRARGVLVRDVNTGEIALLAAQRLTAKLGGKPYLVVAQFSRRDADANRAPDSGEAYENDAARGQYDAYHAALRAAVDECRRVHGRAILIDVHGQSRAPEAIVRGTRNGATVRALLDRAGPAALVGPDSVFGRLKRAGHQVLPDPPGPGDGPDGAAPEPGLGRETFFDGGYIVARYGSGEPDGVDAIQVEIGARRSDALLAVSRDLGDAIAAFYVRFVAPAGGPDPAPVPGGDDADAPPPAGARP